MKLNYILFLICLCSFASAQNIGINTDGSLPGMMLDVKPNTGNDGIRINNTANDAIINLQNNGTDEWTFGFDDSDGDNFKISNGGALGTNDRFVIDDNDNQIRSGFDGTLNDPTWSFTTDEDLGMFRAAADELAFVAGGVEFISLDEDGTDELIMNDGGVDMDVRIESLLDNELFFVDGGNGRIGISTNTPSSLFHVDGINAVEIAWIDNSSPTGTGIIMTGQNGIYNGLVAGSGSSSTGDTFGSYVYYGTAGVGSGMVIQDGFGAQWDVGLWNGGYSKIIGNGGVSTIIDDPNGKKVTMFCIEAPENLFQDYGTGELINGEAQVNFDPIFSNSIRVDDKHDIRVMVQLEGDCKGVFVSNKTKDGFTVKELDGGNSNVKFTYTVVATRANEIYYGMNGETRVADYGARYPDAPEYKENFIRKER